MGFLIRNWRLIASVVSIAVLLGGAGGVYLKIKHDAFVEGHDAGYAEASAKCAAEKKAMEEANKKAIDEAAKKLAEAERELASVEVKLEDYMNALDLLADQGDDAGGLCLYAPSVRRLSAIQ